MPHTKPVDPARFANVSAATNVRPPTPAEVDRIIAECKRLGTTVHSRDLRNILYCASLVYADAGVPS